VSGGYDSLQSIGPGLKPYTQANGGAGMSYGINRSLHVIARYDARHQAIDQFGYNHMGYRMAIGLTYSPGDVPLSLW
jgi:hypothetical protein